MECNICTEAFDRGERLPKGLPCGHTFCLRCLRNLTNQKCPQCRTKLQGPPAGFSNNFALMQLLLDVKQGRTDANEKPSWWCSECRTTAKPQCWTQHDVMAVSAALKQCLEDVLPALTQAAGQLEALKDQCQGEQAMSALSVLTRSSSCHLTLRVEDGALSGTLRSSENPMTKALLMIAAATGELKEDGNHSSTFTVVDFLNDLGKNQAANMELLSELQVVRLLNVSEDVAPEVLQAAAPTVEQLSMSCPSPAVLRVTLAMPRLKRLHVSDPYYSEEDAALVRQLLQELPAAPAPLQWLEVTYPHRDVLLVLLRAHRLTLEVLLLEVPLDTFDSSTSKMSCSELFSVLRECNLSGLRRLVLTNILSNLAHSSKPTQQEHTDCARQRGLLRRALSAGAEVLCWHCDKETAAKEVF